MEEAYLLSGCGCEIGNFVKNYVSIVLGATKFLDGNIVRKVAFGFWLIHHFYT